MSGEKKNARIVIRIPIDEKLALKQRAKAEHKSLSQVVRDAAAKAKKRFDSED